MTQNEPKRPAAQPTVLPYGRTIPPSGIAQGWRLSQVVLGLLIGLFTVMPELPLYLLWAYKHLRDTWTDPLAAYAAILVAMVIGAATVRRRDRLPGLLPGLSAGLAAGMLVIAAFVWAYT